jgi:hypothetical protein
MAFVGAVREVDHDVFSAHAESRSDEPETIMVTGLAWQVQVSRATRRGTAHPGLMPHDHGQITRKRTPAAAPDTLFCAGKPPLPEARDRRQNGGDAR